MRSLTIAMLAAAALLTGCNKAEEAAVEAPAAEAVVTEEAAAPAAEMATEEAAPAAEAVVEAAPEAAAQ
jgi:nitrous oxide reductase accessory protein NosL